MEHGEGSQNGPRNPRSNSAFNPAEQQQHQAYPAPLADPYDQDYYVPVANITRIMRRALPAHAKIADDAKETIQQCVSEYINLITSEANDHCKNDRRKTLGADDVLKAVAKLGFDNYTELLTLYLNRYRAAQREERNAVDFGRLPLPTYGLPPAVLPHFQVPPHFPAMMPEGIFDISRAGAADGMDLGYYMDNAGAGSSSSGQGGGMHGFGPYDQFK